MEQFTAHKFNQHPSEVQGYAKHAPVLITKHGKPDQVLMSYEEFLRLSQHKTDATQAAPKFAQSIHQTKNKTNTATKDKDFVSIADALGFSDASDIDFDPPRVNIGFRPVNFE